MSGSPFTEPSEHSYSLSVVNKLLCFQQSRESWRVMSMSRMALMAPKRAQQERNALCALFTYYAPFYRVAAVASSSARLR